MTVGEQLVRASAKGERVGHIPADATWYIGELVEEITVAGDHRNVVHRNFTLIRADSPEEAYQKALKFGEQGQTSYDNPQGQRVEIKFRGIADLDVIHDELQDGAELMFYSQVGLNEEELQRLIRTGEAGSLPNS